MVIKMKFNTTLMFVATVLIIIGIFMMILANIMWRDTYNMAKCYENASQNPLLLSLGQGYNDTIHLWFNCQLNQLMDIEYTSMFMAIGGLVLIAVVYLRGKRLKKRY